MNLNKPLLNHAIVSNSTLDALDRGLKRLREFGGHVYRPEDTSRQTSSFWFPPPSFMEMQQGNTDRDVKEYQKVLCQYKLARAALTAMSQSFELEMYKFRQKMQPVVISRGLANIPDEVLGNILSLYLEPHRESTCFRFRNIMRIKQVCKRFSNIIDKEREIWSHITNGMRPEEIGIRLKRSAAVGLKIYLSTAESALRASFQSAVKTLLPHAARWQELSLIITSGKDLDVFSKLDSATKFPKLQQLAVTNKSSECLSFDDGAPYGSWNMPQLRQLSFKDDLLVPTAARITSLDLRVTKDEWRFEDLHGALDSLSATLTSLRLGFRSVQLGGDDNLVVRLPCLRTMHLDFDFDIFKYESNGDEEKHDEYGEHVSRIFNFALFETRKLERLTVSLSSAVEWRQDTKAFLNNLSDWQRVSTALRYFNLIHAPSKYNLTIDILDVLHNLSAIESIYASNVSIECPQPHRWDFERRARFDALGEASRCLRQLHLDECIQTKGQIEGLLQVLTNSAFFPEFERLVLSNCTGFKWEELAGLKGLEYLVLRNE